jgi:uncharacterized protein (DUF4415 family)
MKKSASQPDDENPEWTEEEMRRARPLLEVLPKAVVDAIRRARGPQKAPTKKLISIRVDQDVVNALRASGTGWQSRANDALKAYVKRRGLDKAAAPVRKRRRVAARS